MFFLTILLFLNKFCCLQRIITEASADLYTATRKRSYIKSVQILIPQTWGNVNASDSTWENFQVHK
jgi:hypothetical protein